MLPLGAQGIKWGTRGSEIEVGAGKCLITTILGNIGIEQDRQIRRKKNLWGAKVPVRPELLIRNPQREVEDRRSGCFKSHKKKGQETGTCW